MNWFDLTIGLLFTMIAYLIFPAFYKHFKGKVSPQKATKIALINSLVWAFIFSLLLIVYYEPAISGISFVPAFFYYFIAKAILSDKNLSEEKHVPKYAQNKHVNFNLAKSGDVCESSNKSVQNANDTDYYIQKVSINQIKKLQHICLIILAFILAFSIIYTLVGHIIYKEKLPSIKEFKTQRIIDINANDKVYYKSNGNVNYLYVKVDNEIVLYRFLNYSMYGSGSSVRIGYATSAQIREYFGDNLTYGMPTINFILPHFISIGLIIAVLSCCAIIVICFYIYRIAEENIFKLAKVDTVFKQIKEDYKNDNISKYNYRKQNKTRFSEEIMNNKGIMKIFRFIY